MIVSRYKNNFSMGKIGFISSCKIISDAVSRYGSIAFIFSTATIIGSSVVLLYISNISKCIPA